MSPHQLLASCWTTAGDAAPLRGDERSPFAIGDRIEAVAAAGLQGFGINQADLAATRSDPGWSVIRSILDDHGISHVEVEFLNEWWTDDERRRSSDAVRFELLAAAEVLRAGHIKVGSEFSGAPVEPDRFAAEFDILCNQAAEAGTRIALEPMPFSSLPTIASGARFINEVGNPAGGLCIDSWHVFRAGTDPSELPTILDPAIIFAAELNDADAEVVGTLFEDTINNRRLCGQGTWDLPSLVRAMRAAGFDGPWGVEIISNEQRARPLEEAVRLARDTTLQVFDAAESGEWPD